MKVLVLFGSVSVIVRVRVRVRLILSSASVRFDQLYGPGSVRTTVRELAFSSVHVL